MFILGGCGWIPDATVQFIANIVDAIKILTPIILVIMGAIDFGKAVMSQQEDQIKKSQSAFIQKLIAGAAVFFVISFIGWILKLINQADPKLNAESAFGCLNAMLNGGYSADTVTRRTTTKKSTTSDTTVPNSPDDNPLNFKTRQELFNIIKNCKKYSTKNDPEKYCLDARNKFCELYFEVDSSCYKKCAKYNFNTGDPSKAFGKNVADGCTIPDIEDLIDNLPKPVEEDELDTCIPEKDCVCKYVKNKNECDAKKVEQDDKDKNEKLTKENCHNRLTYLYNKVCNGKADTTPNISGSTLADIYAEHYFKNKDEEDGLYYELYYNGDNLNNSNGYLSCQLLYSETNSTTSTKYICSNALKD